jgi:hypothetical protein
MTMRHDEIATQVRADIIETFAEALAGESPGFNKARFLAAVYATGAKQATCAKCGESIRETSPGVWRDISSSDLCANDTSQIHHPEG